MAERPPFAIIIPARFESTRYPGKPLAPLRGARGDPKPLIQRSWECARTAAAGDSIWVATDDNRIADAVAAFGGQVVMTSPDCRNGTERCADAVRQLGEVADIVVNLQGDAPLTPAFVPDRLVDALAADPSAVVATPAVACSPSVYRHLAADEAAGRVGGTTVISDRQGYALYFSKRVLPYIPAAMAADAHRFVRLHLGIYAYRTAALQAYAEAAVADIEQLEGLEQLRFLDAGLRVRAVPFAPLDWDCIELNNPEDVPAIEQVLKDRGLA